MYAADTMDDPPATWRMHGATKLAVLAVTVPLATAFTVEVATDAEGVLIAIGALATVGLLIWRGYFHPSLTLEARTLTVRNPIRTKRIRLGDVTSIEPEWDGLSVTTSDDSSIRAWAVQKPNIALMLGRRTRADRVAETILAARDDHA